MAAISWAPPEAPPPLAQPSTSLLPKEAELLLRASSSVGRPLHPSREAWLSNHATCRAGHPSPHHMPCTPFLTTCPAGSSCWMCDSGKSKGENECFTTLPSATYLPFVPISLLLLPFRSTGGAYATICFMSCASVVSHFLSWPASALKHSFETVPLSLAST